MHPGSCATVSRMNEMLRDWLLDPLALLFLFSLALSLGFATYTYRWWGGMFLWVLAFLVVSAPAIVNPLLATLEERFPDSSGCPEAGFIVVLGGGVNSQATRVDDYGAMSAATLARISAGLDLLKSYPETRIIVSGGGRAAISEASMMQSFLLQAGIAGNRIVAESNSANTRENAREVARLFEELSYTGQAMLVSSAVHLPRAAGDFVAQGVEVCAVPVDRLRIKRVPFWALMPQISALRKFDFWLHEVTALTVYRFR